LRHDSFVDDEKVDGDDDNYIFFPLSGSTLCTLHLLTPNRPLLLSGNDTIMLAPYHTHYPLLEQHMASVGLTAILNQWDRPLCIGTWEKKGNKESKNNRQTN
jgi:hypothetical protein